MGDILYFIPERSNITVDRLRELGLGFAFDDELLAKRGIVKSIEAFGNNIGTICARSGGQNFGYYPDKQTWNRLACITDVEVYWGYNNDQKPTPADLQRAECLPGKDLKLSDENSWHVPIAREYASVESIPIPICALPCKISMVDGKLQRGINPLQKYQELWRIANEWAVHMGSGQGITIEDCHIKDAGIVLSANYRLCLEQVFALEMITSDLRAAFDILNVLIDFDSLVEMIKAFNSENEPDDKKKRDSTEQLSSGTG